MQASAALPRRPLPVDQAGAGQAAQLKPMGAPPEKPAGATPWLFIGIASAAVFALVGVLVFFLRRKRNAGKGKPAKVTGPGLIASVKNRLMPAKKGEPAPSKPAAG